MNYFGKMMLPRYQNKLFEWSLDTIIKIADAKRIKRGGFEEKVFLVETSELPLIPSSEFSDQTTFTENYFDKGKKIFKKNKINFQQNMPKLLGKKIIIPLVPPNFFSSYNTPKILLKDSNSIIEITYDKKEIILEIKPLLENLEKKGQLLLFD
jgi:hypothetical protein